MGKIRNEYIRRTAQAEKQETKLDRQYWTQDVEGGCQAGEKAEDHREDSQMQWRRTWRGLV